MKIIVKLVSLFAIVSFVACKETDKKQADKNTVEQTKELGYQIPNSWIEKRVTAANKRLNATEAGKVLWSAIEAHGGLKKWYSNGYLSFRFNYQPLNGKGIRDSYQTIDTWNNKARHNSITDKNDIFGWDGKESWIKAKDSTSFKYDTKFWALTPIYFSGQPFVFDGKGVNLELLPQVTFKGKTENVVKVTYDGGVGSAPDDYYIMYINAETNLLDAFKYIVSYPEYFPNGGHAPEKITVTQGTTTVNGIVFAKGFKTYWSDEEKENGLGEYITNIDVSDISFSDEVEENYFSKPEGAKILK
ncbi:MULTISPECIES: DUF6503 family protein [unclassified Cellulophaga]|uniref:DUF6503 family protein n=1 Tax=unclassified Cellulophaga TaxID=2634405 RepID=UPI0026E2307E|nr:MULTISPECIES: DUF6503 family protein [unclassified Cellulophaga]MDO6490683.1 hypothetical protein [Cellulophaga sp. 2_MG-2023]MDO6494123.1 hypothetical protein [Cellulophaga sp. 3_MG-2023]